MTPVADFLQLKTGVDVEPTSPEDKALLLVDQVRWCRKRRWLQSTLVSNAVGGDCSGCCYPTGVASAKSVPSPEDIALRSGLSVELRGNVGWQPNRYIIYGIVLQ